MSLSETCIEQRHKDEQKVKLWIIAGLTISAVLHGGLFALAFSGFLDRELEIVEEDAIEFIVVEEEVVEEEQVEPEPEEVVDEERVRDQHGQSGQRNAGVADAHEDHQEPEL